MKLLRQEPKEAINIYVNSETNTVHLLMPITSAASPSLDNPSMSVYSLTVKPLQNYFGLLGTENQNTALQVLEEYKAALCFDLKYISDSKEKALIEARLAQINEYLKIFYHMIGDEHITDSLDSIHPFYPDTLINFMHAKESNLHSLVLSSNRQDFCFEYVAYPLGRYSKDQDSYCLFFPRENDGVTSSVLFRTLLECFTGFEFDLFNKAPFGTVSHIHELSFAIRFFLAELNLVCRDQGLTESDWGAILEENPGLIQDLATTVKSALQQKGSVEDALIEAINQHRTDFELAGVISQGSICLVKERFLHHYAQVKASGHTRHGLLGHKPGLFFCHQGYLSTQFALFVQSGFLDNKLDESSRTFLQTVQQDFERVLETCNAAHLKPYVYRPSEEFGLDLSIMNETTLQALYEDIHSYQDPKIKNDLLAQFKKERPDFTPKIYAKDFLQHVAYDELEEAEALLQQDPQLAQQRLRACHIPFTDYSGRTFTCTAYEYAYCVKNTAMLKMLGRYILQDEETRQLLSERVRAMKALKKPTSAAGLFELPKPRGLHYTTQDKQGQVIEHWELHIGIEPLNQALQHYADDYNRQTDRSEAVQLGLAKLWREEVGGAQRNVPAHIANACCNPRRTLSKQDGSDHTRPNKLFKFRNLAGCAVFDWWFYPGSYLVDAGLGFSFAVLRRECSQALGVRGRVTGKNATDDLAFLRTLDAEATRELQTLFEDLCTPLEVHTHTR